MRKVLLMTLALCVMMAGVAFAEEAAAPAAAPAAKIGVVDLRNYNLSIDDLMESEGYDQVLILYNFQSFKSDARLPNLNR